MKTHAEDLAITATKISLAIWQQAEQKRFEIAQEVRSWEAELHRVKSEIIMVKMTDNHQQFAELYREKRHIERSLKKSESSSLNIQSLCQSFIQSPIILN